MNNDILPQGVEDTLGDAAIILEKKRRVALDLLVSRGFDMVFPPIMEFSESLLTVKGSDLSTQTYQFMDQHTQKLLGVRADITPQIARIDAQYFKNNAENRLCYVGTVLRTKPEIFTEQRELLQVGAEIFGVTDIRADIEIIDAMLAIIGGDNTLPMTLSLGHAGIYQALLAESVVTLREEAYLFDILSRQSTPDMMAFCAQKKETLFLTLMSLNGGTDMLRNAQKVLPRVDAINNGLLELEQLITYIQKKHPAIDVHVNLSDVYGYQYHSGLKYALFLPNKGRAIAKGGRYDNVASENRAATGFSTDLKMLSFN